MPGGCKTVTTPFLLLVRYRLDGTIRSCYRFKFLIGLLPLTHISILVSSDRDSPVDDKIAS